MRQRNIFRMPYTSLADIFEMFLILDFNSEDTLDKLFNECIMFLEFELDNPQDIDYLDYDINVDREGNKVEIIVNNLVTGLWFLGIFPTGNLEKLCNINEYINEGIRYKYNNKTKKMSKKQIK